MPDKIDPQDVRQKQEELEREQARDLALTQGKKAFKATQIITSDVNTKQSPKREKDPDALQQEIDQLNSEIQKLKSVNRRLQKQNDKFQQEQSMTRKGSIMRFSMQRGVPFNSLARIRGQSILTKTSMSEQPVNQVAKDMLDEVAENEENGDEDPEVDALLEKGPLTNNSLEQLEVKPRSKGDLSKAGFRMLVESKKDKAVMIEKVAEGVFHAPTVTKLTIKLKWVKQPRNVLIIKRPGDPDATAKLTDICEHLNRTHGMKIILERSIEHELQLDKMNLISNPEFVDSLKMHQQPIDFIVCLGGDGTVLWASGLFKQGIPPIVSFKMGSLGFMTRHPIKGYKSELKKILQRDMEATVRARLQVLVRKANGVSEVFTCLNEAVMKHPSKMVSLDLSFEEDQITTVHADGLIIASPTGSTAYSLACGGSMLHPAVPAMVVTPIAPHTLSFRPIVLPDSSTLKIALTEKARTEAYLSVDGRDPIEVNNGDEVFVSISEYPMAAYCLDGESQDWFSTIKESFMWNERVAQKALNN